MGFFPHLLLAILEGTVAAAVLALSALGLSLVFGVMRVVNVAHGEFFALGGYALYIAMVVLGLPPAVGLVLSTAAVFAFGLVAFGFLGMGPVTIAVDSYGPVTDNAQSVFELSVIEQIPGRDETVQLRQRGDLGHRDQVAAAEPADLSFHPAFLMSALLARTAKEAIDAVVTAQGDEAI